MHWTYQQFKAESELSQGDILRNTPALRKTLDEVHPWFGNAKYTGFIVLTQACDLVKGRGNPCKARHIAISPIRPLREYLKSTIPDICDHYAGDYYSSRSKDIVEQMLDKVINQNENSQGLFYIHPESSIGFAEESVATLRVSISLKSSQHYATLSEARRGRLSPEFISKLGWIVGNLYSRVGVPDWKDTEDKENAAHNLVTSLIKELTDGGVKFIDSRKLEKHIKSNKATVQGMTQEQFMATLNKHAGRAFTDIAYESLSRILGDRLDAKEVAPILASIKGDPEFRQTIKGGRE